VLPDPQPTQETTHVTPPQELTARVFRALYSDYDLTTMDTFYIVTPKGTPVLVGSSLGWIARQLTGDQHPNPAPLPSEPRPAHGSAGNGHPAAHG
jgi:hypothetical protein